MRPLRYFSLLLPFVAMFVGTSEAEAQIFHRMRRIEERPCCPAPAYQVIQCQPASQISENATQTFPFGMRTEMRMRSVTTLKSEQRTRTIIGPNGIPVEVTETVQVPVTESVQEEVQIARTRDDVVRDTEAQVSQLSRNVIEIQQKLLKIQKEDQDAALLPTLQTLETLIKELKDGK